VETKPTILAVDDTPANLVALEAVLEREFEVRTARSGDEAITMLCARSDVDVILMDLQMPGMDGYEAAAAIKKLPNCGDIPIVFVTAVFSEDPHVKRGYDVGGVDYFTKPYDPDLLRRKVGIYASFHKREQNRERQLRETADLLRAERELFEALKRLPTGVLVFDKDGLMRESNDEATRISEGRTGCDWWDAEGTLLASALRGESLRGGTKAVHSSASPVRAHDGAITGAVVVIQDISEAVRLESELEDKITHLVAVDRAARTRR
jgi:CheY-like chemotaxis protein